MNLHKLPLSKLTTAFKTKKKNKKIVKSIQNLGSAWTATGPTVR